MFLFSKNKWIHKTWVGLFFLFMVFTSFHAHGETHAAEKKQNDCSVCSFLHQPTLHSENSSVEGLKFALTEKTLFTIVSHFSAFSYLTPNLRAPPLFLSI